MHAKVIVALDFHQQADAIALCEQLDPNRCAVKVGNEMFTRFGHPLVKQLIAMGFKLFLDLKFHDIPNTVARACEAAADLGVWMLNVHAAGGLEMMSAARKAIDNFGSQKPLLIAVTVLTSMDENALHSTGVETDILAQVKRLAHLAKEAEFDGVVCSAFEAQAVKAYCGEKFLTVTPGIRLPTNSSDDQKRIVTPDKAISMGSDYLVMGRPITRSSNPMQTLEDIHQMISV